MFVLFTGVDVYNRLLDRGRSMYDQRTAAGYISTRIRQADRAGAVRLEMFEGESTLVFREMIEATFYETKIYARDGYMRELFTEEGATCFPEEGEKILPIQSMTFSETENMLAVVIVTEDGREQELLFYLRSREGHVDEE